MSNGRHLTAVVFCLVIDALPASGQAAIVGRVTDTSASGLSDVIVEASSPALIEKVRRAVTESSGRYRIEHLPPGNYAVRFTGRPWATLVRTGVELTGSRTVTVDAALAAGFAQDTIIVSGTLPVIDTYRANPEVTLSGDTARGIPTARGYNALLVLIPGVLTSTNNVVTETASTSFPIHGGRVNEGRLSVDGLTVGSPPSGNSATSYAIDVGSAQEITFSRGGLGEAETAGLVMNVVPRSGGNTSHGSVFAGATGRALQSDNLTPSLESQGVTAATPLERLYDVAGTFGGPLLKDRLW